MRGDDETADTHCATEQEELAFSVALLHNRTREKIRRVRESVTNLETTLQRLEMMVETEKRRTEELRGIVSSLQKNVRATKEEATLAQTGVVVLTVCVCVYIVGKLIGKAAKWLRETQEEESRLKKQVEMLQKQVVALSELCVKREMEKVTVKKESEKTLVKKESKKMSVKNRKQKQLSLCSQQTHQSLMLQSELSEEEDDSTNSSFRLCNRSVAGVFGGSFTGSSFTGS